MLCFACSGLLLLLKRAWLWPAALHMSRTLRYKELNHSIDAASCLADSLEAADSEMVCDAFCQKVLEPPGSEILVRYRFVGIMLRFLRWSNCKPPKISLRFCAESVTRKAQDSHCKSLDNLAEPRLIDAIDCSILRIRGKQQPLPSRSHRPHPIQLVICNIYWRCLIKHRPDGWAERMNVILPLKLEFDGIA